MKILNRLKTDAKMIIRDLHNANDSLIDTVVEYQQIIFDQKETIMCQVEEIERLKNDCFSLANERDAYKDVLETAVADAIKEFAKRLTDKADPSKG